MSSEPKPWLELTTDKNLHLFGFYRRSWTNRSGFIYADEDMVKQDLQEVDNLMQQRDYDGALKYLEFLCGFSERSALNNPIVFSKCAKIHIIKENVLDAENMLCRQIFLQPDVVEPRSERAKILNKVNEYDKELFTHIDKLSLEYKRPGSTELANNRMKAALLSKNYQKEKDVTAMISQIYNSVAIGGNTLTKEEVTEIVEHEEDRGFRLDSHGRDSAEKEKLHLDVYGMIDALNYIRTKKFDMENLFNIEGWQLLPSLCGGASLNDPLAFSKYAEVGPTADVKMLDAQAMLTIRHMYLQPDNDGLIIRGWGARPAGLADMKHEDMTALISQIYNSVAIEGNTLTKEEVTKIVEHEEDRTYRLLVQGRHPEKHEQNHLEIHGMIDAIKYIWERKFRREDLFSIDDIKNIHRRLMQGNHHSAGSFRSTDVFIRESPLKPVEYDKVESEMKKFVDFIQEGMAFMKQNLMHPVELAALVHFFFLHVHPFNDGNGRLGRLLLNIMLEVFEYPAIIIEYERRQDYMDAIALACLGDMRTFFRLIANYVIDSLKKVQIDGGIGTSTSQ